VCRHCKEREKTVRGDTYNRERKNSKMTRLAHSYRYVLVKVSLEDNHNTFSEKRRGRKKKGRKRDTGGGGIVRPHFWGDAYWGG